MFRYIKRWSRFFWRYVRGDAPWDSGIVPPEIRAWIESGSSPPGRALDLGCGTGTTSLYLAAHGWDVVGVDFVPNAIWRARRAAQKQHVSGRVTFHVADVSRLGFLPDDQPFDLVVDIGCLHGLYPEQRVSYADHLARLARPGAVYWLYAFLPRPSRSGDRMVGIDADGLRALFGPAFEIMDSTLGEDVTGPVGSGWYTLRRTERAL
ncbi:MAG: class I SAM-dependent methyltransferase [Anaerolineae bacterium]|nr:class I SAM-dependent methyltransferase [Anaerolineae bacterium]